MTAIASTNVQIATTNSSAMNVRAPRWSRRPHTQATTPSETTPEST
jgi:hypothetical protein